LTVSLHRAPLSILASDPLTHHSRGGRTPDIANRERGEKEKKKRIEFRVSCLPKTGEWKKKEQQRSHGEARKKGAAAGLRGRWRSRRTEKRAAAARAEAMAEGQRLFSIACFS
jgi:hypothetical protein